MDRYAPLRRRTIALVGLMGVGKSSVGRRLASALSLPFRDTDSEVEAAIQESLANLMHGKTVIAIAHRLSTIAAMDRLIVMDSGAIVEEGTHEELIHSGGL